CLDSDRLGQSTPGAFAECKVLRTSCGERREQKRRNNYQQAGVSDPGPVT
ncbi:MAG: hypothetical protein ACI9BW_004438, partial [Gammaproteobacteria bacterium]